MTFKRLDTGISHTIEELPIRLNPLMRGVSYLGLPVIVVIITSITGLIAWFSGHRLVSLAMTWSLVGLGLSTILKYSVHRARPGTLYVTKMRIKSYSFPSGHAFGSIVLYGLLAIMAKHYLPTPWGLIAMVGAGGLILLIGLSRIYLGAHFPTDVIGGWILGGLTLALIIILVRPF